ncbi:hypothetical protein NLU13_6817 [Sarocladium strictum]|uniref:Uncharacterized protein n=1 Tax=Sarocladium strictum TaxID=5046 RepID=A0AA39L6D4_SARSR|nr:hypothetical protein NLU13_6817 [Sarocladium strictum]
MASASPQVGDVDVYPLFEFDKEKAVDKMNMAWMFHVDKPLDPELLRSSLSRLLQMGDWKKFAGRFKRNGAGQLELHTPRIFPDNYSIIGYSHRDLSPLRAADHEIAGKIPTAALETSSYAIQPRFHDLFHHSNNDVDPNDDIETWIREQLPPLALHVTTFSDATTVSLLWRHNLADGGGMTALVSAWSLVLGGQEDHVPKLLGARESVLDKVGEKKEKDAEDWVMKDKALGRWATLKMLSQLGLKRQLRVHEFHLRHISLSSANVQRLRERSLTALDRKGLQRPESLGNSLLIRALFLKMAVQAESKVRNVLLIMPVDSRRRLPAFQEADGVYVQNMLSWVFMSLPIEIVLGPLASLALEISRHIEKQSTPAQVSAFFRYIKERSQDPNKGMLYFTENPGNEFPVTFNDLTPLDIRNKVDFGPAVVKTHDADAGRSGRENARFFMQETMGDSFSTSTRARLPQILCSGKDAFGNYFFRGTLSKDSWESLGRALESDEPI